MPRSDYIEILDEAESMESRNEVWDLVVEAGRLGLELLDLPLDEKGWDRAVNVGYRRAALRGHPDKVPASERVVAEANFKKLNDSHKLLLRVGKAVRQEAESGDAADSIAAAKKTELEAAEEKKRALSKRLADVMSLNGVATGFGMGSRNHKDAGVGSIPGEAQKKRTKGDLQRQMAALLSKCGDEFEKRARRKRRIKILKRILAGALGVAFLLFVRKNAPPDDGNDARSELREIAEGLRAAIRFMGAELAAAVGRPEDSDEMADDLEEAFLEGRMSVNESGGLQVLIPDDDAPGMFYKLNMSSKSDGGMAVWTEGTNGERVEVELGDLEWDDDDARKEKPPGVFGLPAERSGAGKGTVNWDVEPGGNDSSPGGSGSEKKKKNKARNKEKPQADKEPTKGGRWGRPR